MSSYMPAWRKAADEKYAFKQYERANDLARDFYLKHAVRTAADGEGAHGWLSQKRSDFLGDLAADARQDYGYFELVDSRRFCWHIGKRSPINGCRTFRVERVQNDAEWAATVAAEQAAQERKQVAVAVSDAIDAYTTAGDHDSAITLLRSASDLLAPEA